VPGAENRDKNIHNKARFHLLILTFSRLPSNQGMATRDAWSVSPPRVPMKIADRSWSIHEQAFATFLAPEASTLTW